MAAAKGKVCVTGAGGYLGSWLVRLLLSKDYFVHGTVREPLDQKYAHLNRLDKASENLRLFKADLLDYNSLRSAIEGCSGVFHVASPVPPSSVPNPEVELIEPAVKGTLNVLQACVQAKVKRVVLVSSGAAVSMNPSWPKDQVMDESCWSSKEHCRATKNWYCLSKVEAESEAWEYAKRTELDLIVICPTLILGPVLQSSVNASSQVLIKLLKGGYESMENKGRRIVDVRDVAKALVLVYEKPEAEGRYICTAHGVTSRDMVEKLRGMFPNYSYPKNLVDVEGEERKLSSERLQRLGWSFCPLDETLVDSVESYRNAGMLGNGLELRVAGGWSIAGFEREPAKQPLKMSSSSISSPQDPPGPSVATATATATPPPSSSRLHPPPSSSNPASSPVKPEIQTPKSATHRPPPSSDAQLVNFPSYSRWFSWNGIHECEVRFLPEFFDSRSSSKNPGAYMYYRNSIVKLFRQNPSSKITFTEARKTLVGDVGSIRRVFDFLDDWGLINFSPSALKPLKWEDKQSKSNTPSQASADGSAAGAGSAANPSKDTVKRYCSGCKSVCSIACFACDKYDLTLCARCYVRGNYRVGVSSSDFRRVEISEETRKDWTEKETLQLLETIMHYGDDWRKVAQNVTGRSEKDCISHFIKLPFGEEFTGSSGSGDVDSKGSQIKEHDDADSGSETMFLSKRMRLSPLADASNPIMAQAAFLSALAGVDIAEAAAQAAVSVLTEVERGGSKGNLLSFVLGIRQLDSSVSPNVDSNTLNALERVCVDANSHLEEEELEVERAISRIAEIQMKEIQQKMVRFEELDLQMEKEWQQVEQMKSLLFVDQLTHLFPKSSAPKAGDRAQES